MQTPILDMVIPKPRTAEELRQAALALQEQREKEMMEPKTNDYENLKPR